MALSPYETRLSWPVQYVKYIIPRSTDPFDGAAHPHRGRLLLGKGRGCGKQGKARRAESAPCHRVHCDPPEPSPADQCRPPNEQPTAVMLIPAAAISRPCNSIPAPMLRVPDELFGWHSQDLLASSRHRSMHLLARPGGCTRSAVS